MFIYNYVGMLFSEFGEHNSTEPLEFSFSSALGELVADNKLGDIIALHLFTTFLR